MTGIGDDCAVLRLPAGHDLLTSTDLTLEEIGTRMECAKSSVVAINQNYHIRQYRGRRSSWICTVTEKGGDTSGDPKVVDQIRHLFFRI